MGAGVAVLKDEAILLIRRRDNSLWDVPGGGLESGETPEAAARRELAEETGLSVGVLRPLAVFQHPHTYPDGNRVDWETHFFTADDSGDEVKAGDDAREARWWLRKALPQNVSDATQHYFTMLGQFMPLSAED
ncbi:NUDIX domain-containing protein [Deinococcus sp. AJ005]|nr:NUDIX domain-containing protein [Deinococcus sp. AJ005]